MADNNPQQAAQQPVFSIEKIYVRDLSIEVPNAPKIFLVNENPQINVQLRTEGTSIDDGLHEVKLTITVKATVSEDRTLFLVETTQAGIFQIRNVPENELELVTLIGCPNILFPYARETISDAITRAGFPPILLAPVNFEAIYQARQQQQQANGSTNGAAQ
ncbi:MAG: protein-export chaperone SecB [Azoarcus sp.]|jgi:preprotein translocase subunit SecB|nr:protein-export chaperone SecB [Azoarcus sp.]